MKTSCIRMTNRKRSPEGVRRDADDNYQFYVEIELDALHILLHECISVLQTKSTITCIH